MSTTEHVSITITQDSVGVTRDGFGLMLILSHTADFPERIRFYGGTAEVGEDFASDSPEYGAASAAFAQTPRPEQVAIGRMTGSVTLEYTIDAGTAKDSHAYGIHVEGEGVTETDISYTSDSAATVAEIHNALVTQLNAVVGNNYIAEFAPLVNPDDVFTADDTTETFTATAHGLLTGDGPFQVSNSGGALPTGLTAATDYWIIRLTDDTFQLATTLAFALAGTNLTISSNGTGTQTLEDTADTVRPDSPFTVTGDDPGDWFALDVASIDDLAIAMTHGSVTGTSIADDLAAIALENDSWYAVYSLFNSTDYADDVADAIESLKKVYIGDVCDSSAATVAEGSGTDVLDDWDEENKIRTAGFWHQYPSQFFGAAFLGAWLPKDPGSDKVAYNTLSGVTVPPLTGTHRTNLAARRATYYKEAAGFSFNWQGQVGSETRGYIDVTRNLDWLENEVVSAVMEALLGGKIDYTDEGVSVVTGKVRGSMLTGVRRRVLAADPAPVVTAPKVATISAADKANRILPDVKFAGVLTGAIHSVAITGTISL